MKVLVVGCGRIGSPLLTWLAFRKQTNPTLFTNVAGVDIDETITDKPVSVRFKEYKWQETLDKINDKPIIYNYRQAGWLGPQDVIIMTCGTPIDKNQNPDTSQITAAIDALYENGLINYNTLIILRSTVFPGGTRWLRRYITNRGYFAPSIVMAPERIAEGNTFIEIDQIPQIIGADSPDDLKEASDFFQHQFGSVSTIEIGPEHGGTKAAELAKLFCNTWRYIQFAAANEFSMLCEEADVDFNVVREACNRSYWRSNIPQAALNVGGPCLGKDAKTLSAFSSKAEITEAAYKVAEKTPLFYLEQNRKQIHGKIVGVLGLAFKKNSDNKVNSLSYKIIKLLEIMYAKNILVYDPLIEHKYSVQLNDLLENADTIIVATEHDAFKDIDFGHKTIIRL